MSFLNDTVTSRQFVVLCARLFVQCALAWSGPPPGMGDLKSLNFPLCASNKPIARHEREPIALPLANHLAAFRQRGKQRVPG